MKEYMNSFNMNILYVLNVTKASMNHLNIQHLPNEIFFNIFRELNMVDVFYSFVDLNHRFDQLALDYFYIRNLNITNINIINSLYNHTSSVDNEILSKICSRVLPRIQDKIYSLTIEEYSMKQVLLAANYSQLYSLSLLNFDEETLYQSLQGTEFDFL